MKDHILHLVVSLNVEVIPRLFFLGGGGGVESHDTDGFEKSRPILQNVS